MVCSELSCEKTLVRPMCVWKSVPQRLKPLSTQTIYGTAEAVPFVRQSLAQPLGSVKAPVLSKATNWKNLIWTTLKLRPSFRDSL
jgi:hypothetical protein